jgi:hypothetical protein
MEPMHLPSFRLGSRQEIVETLIRFFRTSHRVMDLDEYLRPGMMQVLRMSIQ